MRALLLRRQNLSALSIRFRAENAATNEALGNLTILRVWLASPIVLDAATEIVGKRTRHARFYQVNFPAIVPDEDQFFLLESTRPQSNAPWQRFRILEAAELARPTTITVNQTPNITALEGYLGPLQFRLVPVTVLPPEKPPQ